MQNGAGAAAGVPNAAGRATDAPQATAGAASGVPNAGPAPKSGTAQAARAAASAASTSTRQAVFDSLYREVGVRAEKLAAKRRSLERQEKAVCTFAPKVDPQSSRMVAGSSGQCLPTAPGAQRADFAL